jgi:hypothetical protein
MIERMNFLVIRPSLLLSYTLPEFRIKAEGASASFGLAHLTLTYSSMSAALGSNAISHFDYLDFETWHRRIADLANILGQYA